MINNVKHLVQLEDPVSQEEIARRVGVSQPTVSRIIDEDLCLKRLKKPEIKRLSDAMITKRKKRAKGFHQLISDNQENVLTLDEAWLTLDYTTKRE